MFRLFILVCFFFGLLMLAALLYWKAWINTSRKRNSKKPPITVAPIDYLKMIPSMTSSLPNAKYCKGDKVKYQGVEYFVHGVNYVDDDENDKPVFEYCLDGLNHLVWEQELQYTWE